MPVEIQALEAMLRSFLPAANRVRVSDVTPLVGGFSAESARVRGAYDTTDGAHGLDLVVRQAPVDGVLAPYDLARESRILKALQDSPVPVARVIGCDPVGEFLGQPCLVTAFVPGEPLPFFGESITANDPRLPAYFGMLATIHTLDWAALGLDFLNEPAGPIEVELLRSQARLAYHGGANSTEEDMLTWLRGNMPDDGRTSFVHGDPNHANYLFAGTQIAAVLDWELALLGDPRLDLGFYASAQSVFGEGDRLDTNAFVRGYAVANPDANLQHLDYFEAACLYRFAAFLRAAERQRSVEVQELRRRLIERFDRIVAGGAEANAAER